VVTGAVVIAMATVGHGARAVFSVKG